MYSLVGVATHQLALAHKIVYTHHPLTRELPRDSLRTQTYFRRFGGEKRPPEIPLRSQATTRELARRLLKANEESIYCKYLRGLCYEGLPYTENLF